MGIDNNYNITLDNLRTGILRAQYNNEVLILYAHKIDESGEEYTIYPDYLEEVLQTCQEEEAEFIRIRDLASFFHSTDSSAVTQN